MSRINLTTLLALSALALPAFAQVIFGPGMGGGADRGMHGRVTDREDIYMCQASPGGSRVRENCEVETTTLKLDQQMRLAFKLNAPPAPLQCGASTTTRYQQRDTVARVSGTLEIHDCAAASGMFTVAVRVKDDSGVEKPLEFSQPWQRSDDQDVAFTADYPIGENVDLVSVSLRGLTCTCTGLLTNEDAPAEDAPAEPLPAQD
jgi:hypothetical protein